MNEISKFNNFDISKIIRVAYELLADQNDAKITIEEIYEVENELARPICQ